jgi:hypothetical protein
MSVIEEVNDIKSTMLKVCEKIADLQKRGIRVEFQIADAQLVKFIALQEMKLSS